MPLVLSIKSTDVEDRNCQAKYFIILYKQNRPNAASLIPSSGQSWRIVLIGGSTIWHGLIFAVVDQSQIWCQLDFPLNVHTARNSQCILKYFQHIVRRDASGIDHFECANANRCNASHMMASPLKLVNMMHKHTRWWHVFYINMRAAARINSPRVMRSDSLVWQTWNVICIALRRTAQLRFIFSHSGECGAICVCN